MPLKKNTSSDHKDTQLTTLFKDHFSGYLQLQRVRVICMIIKALCKVRSVNFSKLSSGFDNQTETSSYCLIKNHSLWLWIEPIGS
jgi:hypothetical protein